MRVVSEKESFEAEESVEDVLAAIKKALTEQAFGLTEVEQASFSSGENRKKTWEEEKSFSENSSNLLTGHEKTPSFVGDSPSVGGLSASVSSAGSAPAVSEVVASSERDSLQTVRNGRIFELTPVMRIDLEDKEESVKAVSDSSSFGSVQEARGKASKVRVGEKISDPTAYGGKKSDLGGLLFELIRPALQKWLEGRYFIRQKIQDGEK